MDWRSVAALLVLAFTLRTAAGLTGLSDRQNLHPYFLQEPPNRVDFLNEIGATIPCEASTVPGFPHPRLQWLGQDNKALQNVTEFRSVYPNGTLRLHPFSPSAYRQDLHTTTIRCIASSSAGTLRSRDVHIRAVVAQQWAGRVVSEPHEPLSKQRNLPVLLKCEIDLIGGGRNFIEVVGWKWDNHHLPVKPHSVTGERGGRFHLLPNGDLILDRLLPEDSRADIVCFSRHKLTSQQVQSPHFSLTLSDKDATLVPALLDRYQDPVMVNEGEPVILHCTRGYLAPYVRWEKFTSGSWVELVSFLVDKHVMKIGNSLVMTRSRRGHGGQYRCSYKSSGGEVNTEEYHVRISGDPFSVSLSSNQVKWPLGSSTDLLCSSSSDLPVTISWYKDNSPVNPGGRFRLLNNNVLQISGIQREDQGIYQCFGRRERESAQAAFRLQLADSPPRLLLGFLDQTLGGPGPDISLRCVFHSGFPLPKIKWTIDGFPPLPDSRVLQGDHVTSHGDIISYFNITQTRVEDGGLYSCIAANNMASVRHQARLNIYGPPWVRVVQPVVAIAGEFLEIQCPVSGYPIAGISWEKDGLKLPLNQRQRVGGNGTLTLTLVDKAADGGSYTCSAWDSQGRTARRDIQVNVVAPLRIAPFPEKGRVVEGERVTLVCSLSSGAGTLRWTKAGGAGAAAVTATSSSRMGPGNNNNNNDRSSSSSAASPSFNVIDTDAFTSLLSISSVEPSHAGTYTCRAADSISAVSRSHELTVLVPVRIEPFAFPEDLREGARSRVVCGVSQGDLPISISITKDDINLESVSGRTLPNISVTSLDSWSKVLQFSYLTSLHSGRYSCHASNSDSRTFHSARLHVQVSPKWVKLPKDTNVSRGEETRIDCFGEGVPPPKIAWFKAEGEGLDSKWRAVEGLWPGGNVRALENGTLVILEAEESHGGSWMCKLENGIGAGESRVVRLGVNVPPYFTKTLERQSVSQGRSHEVSCEVHGDFPIYVSWAKGSSLYTNNPGNRFHVVLREDGKTMVAILKMKDLDPAVDKGVYQCTANNSLGFVSQSFELWVEEKPNSPEELQVQEVGARHAVLTWSPPHGTQQNRNSPGGSSSVLTYIVEYSLAGDKSSMPSQREEVVGERSSIRVESLLPSSSYIFKISAMNAAGNGPAAELPVRTLGAPPSAAPTNVRAQQIQKDKVTISWLPISEESAHGRVLGYRIVAASYLSKEEPIDVVIPAEGVKLAPLTLNGSLHGDLTLPSVFSAKEEITCCQMLLPYLTPFSQYEVRVMVLNSAGEGPPSAAVLFQTLEDAPSSPVQAPSCVRVSSQSVQLSWQPPLIPNGIVNSYKVLYYPIASSSMRFAEVHETSGLTTLLNGLQASTNYSVHITATNNAGDSSSWVVIFCKTLEDIPSPPQDAVGFAASETSVYLSWAPPRRPNGILTHFTVYFRLANGQHDSFESKRKTAPSAGAYLETQLDLSRHKYVFWITASNNKGESGPSNQIILSPPPIVQPELVGKSRKVEVPEGQGLSLFCGLIGLPGGQTPSVRWTIDGGKSIPMTRNAVTKHGQNELSLVGVRKSDQGNYTCTPDDAAQKLVSGSVLYDVRVLGAPSVPKLEYRLQGRNIHILWTVPDNSGPGSDPALGFVLLYRSLGSIQEWQKILLVPTARNYTIKDVICGSILNIFMKAFNAVGESGDSPQLSVHVNHAISEFPPAYKFLIVNSTSVRLSLFPLNSDRSLCPVVFFSVTIRESQPRDWAPAGKMEQIPFRNEYTVGGLKEATSYEILVSTFGQTNSNRGAFSFVTLNQYGEVPAVDVTTKNMVRDYSPFYANLTLVIPVVIAGLAVIAAVTSVLIYCKTRKGRVDSGLYPQMQEISPYATFSVTDPTKKFHEGSFQQEIVVPKFYDVMQAPVGPYRDPRYHVDPRRDSPHIYAETWSRRGGGGRTNNKSCSDSEEDDVDENEEETVIERRRIDSASMCYTELPINPDNSMVVGGGGGGPSRNRQKIYIPSHLPHCTIHNRLSFPVTTTDESGVFTTTPIGIDDAGSNFKSLRRAYPGIVVPSLEEHPDLSALPHERHSRRKRRPP